jgi:tyrosyl-tRNA synthetase
MPEFTLESSTRSVVDLLVACGMAPSKSEARRLVRSGAVSIDGSKLADPAAPVPGGLVDFVLRCGKLKFCRVRRA